MDDIVKEFLVESYESLDRLDQDLVSLENDPTSKEILSRIFRIIHTIKGTCSFLGFNKLESVTHVGENLLSRLRDGELTVNPEIASALLALNDATRLMLENIEESGSEGENDYADLVATLSRLNEGTPAPVEEAVPVEGSATPAEAVELKEEDIIEASAPEPVVEAGSLSSSESKEAEGSQSLETSGEQQGEEVPAAAESANTTAASDDDWEAMIQAQLAAQNKERAQRQAESTTEPLAESGEEKPVVEASAEEPEKTPSKEESPKKEGDTVSEAKETAAAEPAQKTAPKPAGADSRGPSISDSSIRVDVRLLDKLMNLVGELVLARNQIVQFTAVSDDSTLISSCQRLNIITTELQENVMKTRMQPIGNIWSKFPRVVRDLAIACGKQVKIEMEGKDTELDKTIIEAIKDPLTHIIRNSVDHGIEAPEVREANGKSPEGRLLLRAYHEGGQVNIEIIDDGGGIDPEKIKNKAVEKNLITRDVANRMGVREALNLIFYPGFSTAAKVTNVSGRGVGMDVVKSNIEKIGGSVDINSKHGEGTTLKIKIPLTLAIIPALIITCHDERFAIPQVSLLELVRLEGDQARNGIEFIHGCPVYRLRGELLPLVSLNEQLGKVEVEFDRFKAVEDEDYKINIVVLQADDRQFGLVVDEVNDTEEIVVKPLGKQLKMNKCFAGATIMGDGKVALIIDVPGVAAKSGVISKVAEATMVDADEVADSEVINNRETLLVVQVGEENRSAIPLATVDRLEEFSRSSIERVRGQDVVQYRDTIMPLLYLTNSMGYSSSADDSESVQVVVYEKNGSFIGLVVDQILDIVEETVAEKQLFSDGGGSAVIQGKVTDLLNVEKLVEKSNLAIAASSDSPNVEVQ